MKQRVSGPTNPLIASLIDELRVASGEHDAPIWRSIADTLGKPRRQRPEVNLSKINRYSSEDDTAVVVAGKVLATGELQHPVTVAAVGFSARAREKILAANGRAIRIRELLDEHPSGSGVRILA